MLVSVSGKSNSTRVPERLLSYSKNVTKSLIEKEKYVAKLNKGHELPSRLSFEKWNNTDEKSKIHELTFLVYRNDSLLFWSDNSLNIRPSSVHKYETFKVIKTKNGIYDIYKKKFGDKIIITAFRIKEVYAPDNKNLPVKYARGFDIPPEINISLKKEVNGADIYNSQDNFSFSLVLNDTQVTRSDRSLWTVIGAILLYLAFFVALHIVCTKLLRQGKLLLSLVVLLPVSLFARLLSFNNKFPRAIYDLDLFNPSYYAASHFLHSLGDLLINLLLLAWWIYFLAYHIKINNTRLFRLIIQYKVWLGITGVVILIFAHSLLVGVLQSLVIDSNIRITLNNVYQFNFYTFILLLILALLFFIFSVVTERVVYWLKRLEFSNYRMFLILSSGFIFYAGLRLFFETFAGNISIENLWTTLGVGSSAIALLLLLQFVPKINSINGIIILMSYFSVFAGLVIGFSQDIKEKNNRKLIASKFEIEDDLLGEFLINEAIQDIYKDSTLFHLTKTTIFKGSLSQYVKTNYFSGYLKKYQTRVSFYSNEAAKDSILKSFYSGRPGRFRKKAGSMYSFQPKNDERTGYYLLLPLKGYGLVEIVLSPRSGEYPDYYPDMLIDERLVTNKELKNYDYAIYRDGILSTFSGNYQYPHYIEKILPEQNPRSFSFIKSEQFSHLVYNVSPEKTILITSKSKNYRYILSLFSYIFTFLFVLGLLLFVLIFLVNKILPRSSSQSFANILPIYFRTRIQLMMILLLVVSFVLVGWWTVINVKSEYEIYHQDRLHRKMRTVHSLLTYDLSKEIWTSTDWGHYADKLSEINSVNVNIYNTSGKLIASSIPEIIEKGLITENISPTAFMDIINRKNNRFIQQESLGGLEYLAIYAPIHNTEGKLAGILNIPYYADKKDLEKDISSLLGNLINLYVLLFFGIIAFSPLVSYRITRPLSLISHKLQRISLGRKNEPIQWKADDEIGQLVKEYNRMLKALEESARKLARSERESAWREMAKQVAHEIKNPLTPMKLSIQHLQRAYNDNAPNLHELMKRVASTLVEQIDHLSLQSCPNLKMKYSALTTPWRMW